MRTITVYSTSGRNGINVITDVQTWGALKTELSTKQIQHDKMKAVIGETKNTLEAPNAVLPEGDFSLFLMPLRTKSGIDVQNMSYKELRSSIKDEITEHGTEASEFFNGGGKNYTNKSTDEMKSLLQNWLNKLTGKPSVSEKKESIKKEKLILEKPVEEKVIKAKTDISPVVEETVKTEFMKMASSLRDSLAEQVSEIDAFILKHTLTKQASLPITEKKKEELKRIADDIASEFSDVQRS